MTIPTMKSSRTQILTLILVGLISLPARAEVIPGRWEKVSDLGLEAPITVDLKNGDQIEGNFKGLSVSELKLEANSARAVIPKEDILTIATRKKDGLGDGVGIGAALGAGLGIGPLLIAALVGNGADVASVPRLFIFGGIGAGVGAVIGGATDAATKDEAIVLYKASETP